MAIEQIAIRNGHGERTIDAQVYGAFAIHPPDGPPAKHWKDRQHFTVTHIATGYKVGDWSKEHARSIARKLNSALPPGNFDEADFYTEPYAIFVGKAKQIIKTVLERRAAAGEEIRG